MVSGPPRPRKRPSGKAQPARPGTTSERPHDPGTTRPIPPDTGPRRTQRTMPASTRHAPTCDDCYFRRRGLCALHLDSTCPTFRAAGKTLQPPQQPQLVARPLPLVGLAAAPEATGAAA